MGWGMQDYEYGPLSCVLKEAKVTLIDYQNCGTNGTLCSEGTTGSTKVDQVAPLINSYLWCNVSACWICQ